LGAATIFNPTSKTPTKGWSEVQPAAKESLPWFRHPLIGLLFIVSRKIIRVRNPWAGRCLGVFGTRFSLFLSASLRKRRSFAENSKDQAYVLPNVLTFGQKPYWSALEILQLLHIPEDSKTS